MQFLTRNILSFISPSLHSVTEKLYLTVLMTILLHTTVPSHSLSYFLIFAQNILPARYSNVHHHSQLFQNTFY